MAVSAARRRRSAHAAALAAKQRRQKIFLLVLLGLVIAAFAYEAPGVLSHFSTSSSSTGAAVPPTTVVGHTRTLPKAYRGQATDPFLTRALPNGDSTVGPSTGHDPFSASSAAGGASIPAAVTPLPQQLVIGTPTGRGGSHGWIVILASIPTHQGRASAESFAQTARKSGIQSVAVLNSSNRRPLRGGYWVVYTGPVSTLGAVTALAAEVHAVGYGTAYIRELVVYR